MPRRKKFIDGFEDAPDPEQLEFGMPPSTYALSSDVAEVGNRLIANYEDQLGYLTNFRLGFLLRTSQRTDNEFDVQGAGGAFIRGDRERGLYPGFDGGVWVQARWWNAFTPLQRQAWIHGYLLRLGIAPRGGRLRMLRPDVIEWAAIARLYGPWVEQLKLFAQGLDDHGTGASGSSRRPAPAPRPSASDASTAPLN